MGVKLENFSLRLKESFWGMSEEVAVGEAEEVHSRRLL